MPRERRRASATCSSLCEVGGLPGTFLGSLPWWHPVCPLSPHGAGGWGQPRPGQPCRIVPLACRELPVLPGRVDGGRGALLLLLLCQEELGAEQRRLLLQGGAAGHRPSQQHPGESIRLPRPSRPPRGHQFTLITTSGSPQWLPSHHQHRFSSPAPAPLPKPQRGAGDAVPKPHSPLRGWVSPGSPHLFPPALGFPDTRGPPGHLPRGAEAGQPQT